MGELTGIEWCDHTFNPWIGCTKVSAACDHCYAETLVHRYGWAKWGAGEARKRTSEANWKKPLSWDRAAARDNMRRRVFCASLADVFDAEVADAWRLELMQLIHATPNLDWLLLTKRPQVAKKFFLAQAMPSNVWLGTTVESQEMADLRIPILLSIPAKVLFLSCEPLLGPIDVLPYLFIYTHADAARLAADPEGDDPVELPFRDPATTSIDDICTPRIDWVIAGGESGRGARPSHPDWFRSLRDKCQQAEVPFFFKQWGEWAPHRVNAGGDLGGDVRDGRVCIVHPGGETDLEVAEKTGGLSTIRGSRYMVRQGKKAAGAELDGREWRKFPQ